MLGDRAPSQARRSTRAWFKTLTTAALLAVFAMLALPATAQEGEQTGVDPAVLETGAEVFTTICAGCHQPTGLGIPGSFPPLVGNEHVQDSDYVADVIRNGRRGELEVNGTTYNGRMPAFSTLSDDEVTGVIAYIQAGLQLPGGSGGEAGSGLPVAGTTLPALTGMAIVVALALAAGVFALVLGPRVMATTDRLHLRWLDAWLKTALIVAYFVIATVVIPSVVLKTETVGRLPRVAQDLVGSGLWVAGLAIGLAGLWWTHRESRI